MKDVKFRAWDKLYIPAMREVTSINLKTKEVELDVKDPSTYDKYHPLLRTFDNIELLQYTGQHDKNDAEVYEGDIIQYWYPAIPGKRKEETAVIKWPLTFTNLGYDIEVIGNIYQNPELIK